MPIYEYACRECGQEVEVMHKMADPPATDCPECGKPGLTKLVSAAGFRLAGSGWYETDFKKSGEKKKQLVEKEGGKSAEAAPCTPTGCEKPGCAATAAPVTTPST